MVLRAFDLGITHFDLANNYGPPPGSAVPYGSTRAGRLGLVYRLSPAEVAADSRGGWVADRDSPHPMRPGSSNRSLHTFTTPAR